MDIISIIEKIESTGFAPKQELALLLKNINDSELEVLRKKAQKSRLNTFQTKSTFEGLSSFQVFVKTIVFIADCAVQTKTQCATD